MTFLISLNSSFKIKPYLFNLYNYHLDFSFIHLLGATLNILILIHFFSFFTYLVFLLSLSIFLYLLSFNFNNSIFLFLFFSFIFILFFYNAYNISLYDLHQIPTYLFMVFIFQNHFLFFFFLPQIFF